MYKCVFVCNQIGDYERRGSDVNGGEKQRGQQDTGSRNADAGTDMGKKEARRGRGKNNSEPSVLTNKHVDVVMASIPLYVNLTE